jgi:hypothetical protein
MALMMEALAENIERETGVRLSDRLLDETARGLSSEAMKMEGVFQPVDEKLVASVRRRRKAKRKP